MTNYRYWCPLCDKFWGTCGTNDKSNKNVCEPCRIKADRRLAKATIQLVWMVDHVKPDGEELNRLMVKVETAARNHPDYNPREEK